MNFNAFFLHKLFIFASNLSKYVAMQKSLKLLIVLLVLIITATSCITTLQTNYLQPSKNFIASYKDTCSYKDYLLKENDRLYIQVYSMDEKTNALFNGSSNTGMQILSSGGNGSNDSFDLYTYMVHSDGNIDFPIIGNIFVRGKTLRETKAIIEEAIKPILIINSVDVRLVGKTFSIIGAGKSGRFTFPKEKINIFQALALAGDVSQFTDRSKIRILRVNEKGNQIKTFDLRSINIINSEYYYIEPDDIIFLQPLNEQFFGETSLWSTIATLASSATFVVGVYFLIFPVKK